MGEYILTDMLGPVLDDVFNHYHFKFTLPSLVRGQDTKDEFEFDFRNTWSPQLTDGHIDFFMAGDFIYEGEGCKMTPDGLNFVDGDADS